MMDHAQIDEEHHILRYCRPSSIDHDGKPLASVFEQTYIGYEKK